VDYIRDLKELVAEGKVSQARIDDAVRRILDVKYQLGIFESTATDPALTAAVGSTAHREVARQCVRESLVLLKNDKSALPLKKDLKHVAVIGEAADDLGVQCGGWTIDWQGRTGKVTSGGTTILQAIKSTVSPGTEVSYATNADGVKGADAVIVVIGEKPYAEMKGDRTNLNLSMADKELVTQAKSAGAPVITLLISGRPLILGKALDASDAFVACWLPGTEGEGVADVLFGDYRPTGKLPRIWVSTSEQVSNPEPGSMQGDPQFQFGYGLTY
jgi:beta-glucosidase